MDDLISRQALCEYALNQKDKSVTQNDIMRFPSAQSDLDEWCPDCKEYDSKRHCCPRLNRVIRGMLKDSHFIPERKNGKWIPFTTRPLTEEEKEEYPEWDSILNCKLPDDGQQILVSVSVHGHERVQYDEFYTDDGSYLDSEYEIGTEAVAWMPLPEPYGGESE